MNENYQRNNSDIVVSLDIGTTKICCIVARKNVYGEIEVIGVGKAESNGIMRGVVHNVDVTVQAINEAVTQAKREAAIEFDEVFVGIAGQHIHAMQHKGYIMREEGTDYEIRKKDIDKLISDMHTLIFNKGDKIIHVIPQEFTVDAERGIKNPIGMSGVRVEADFHMVIGQAAAVENIHKCVEKAGLKIKELILEPLASAEAVLDNDEKEAGVVLVDIGGGTTDVAIFEDNIIRHTAVIPLGGSIVTKDIKDGCKVVAKHAETMKVKHGVALSLPQQQDYIIAIPGFKGRNPREVSHKYLTKIIEARMIEILGFVKAEIKASKFDNKLIAGLVLTGGGSQLQYLDKLTEYVTGLPTRVGFPSEKLAKASADNLKSPIYATGVGLVIKGFDYVDFEDAKASWEPTPEVEEVVKESWIVRLKEAINGILEPDEEQDFDKPDEDDFNRD